MEHEVNTLTISTAYPQNEMVLFLRLRRLFTAFGTPFTGIPTKGIIRMAILSFQDSLTKIFYLDGEIKKGMGWANCSKVALRKLDCLNYAQTLQDLRSPPSNHLEVLKGDLDGFYSLRINRQWRIIFKWSMKGASEVSIIDYH